MAAKFDTGFFVREPAWHGLGTVLPESPKTWAAARKAAKLDWEPLAAPVFGFTGLTAKGKVTYDPAESVSGDYAQIEDRQRVLRSDTGVNLGVPKASYQVIDHSEMGAIVEALDGQPNVQYLTTVVLDGGRQIAVCIQLNEPVVLPRDNTQTFPFLALTTSHSGDGACRAQSTTVRVVCWNTFSAAEAQADANGTVFAFSHTANWRDHVEEAKEAIRGLKTNFGEYVDMVKELAKVKVTEQMRLEFLEQFIPKPITAGVLSDRQIQNVDDARATVVAILASDTCTTIHGNAFGLLQAGSEYLDWYIGRRSPESRFKKSIIEPQARKRELVTIIRDVCKV